MLHKSGRRRACTDFTSQGEVPKTCACAYWHIWGESNIHHFTARNLHPARDMKTHCVSAGSPADDSALTPRQHDAAVHEHAGHASQSCDPMLLLRLLLQIDVVPAQLGVQCLRVAVPQPLCASPSSHVNEQSDHAKSYRAESLLTHVGNPKTLP